MAHEHVAALLLGAGGLDHVAPGEVLLEALDHGAERDPLVAVARVPAGRICATVRMASTGTTPATDTATDGSHTVITTKLRTSSVMDAARS